MPGTIPSVKVGMYDPFEAYPLICEKLVQKVVLTNLHWRKNATDTLRSITQLPYEIIEETPKFFDNHQPSTLLKIENNESALIDILHLLETPYTRLMFIQCDNLDTYRSQVRPLVIAWKEGNIEKSNCPIEWNLVFVQTDQNSKSQQKVYEKLKTDNNEADGTEHCILLKTEYATPLEENESWVLLGTKLKSSILFSFSKRLEILRDAILVIKNKPLLTIALKEGVARQFFNLRLFEDALNEYNFLLHLVNKTKDVLSIHDDDDLKGLQGLISTDVLFNSESDKISEFDVKSFIFSRSFLTLQTLAVVNSSLSVSSLHVSDLLDKLLSFVPNVIDMFDNSVSVNKWVYDLISEIFSLDICQKILESTERLSEESSTQISERFGELLLLQRSKLLLLGSSLKNYNINGVLTDIPIMTKSNIELDDGELNTILGSKDTFEQKFIELTEAAIRQYGICGRPRTVDILSIDVALLDYQNGQFNKSALILSSCHDFYGSQGWKYIGSSLLETFIDCLENMDSSDEFFETPKDLLLAENYITLLASLNESVNINESTLEATLEKLYKLDLNESPEDFKYDLGKLFTFEVDPFITPIGSGIYEINVNIKTNLNLNFKLEDFEILLINYNKQLIKFNKSEVNFNENDNNIKLQSMNISIGDFKLEKISAKLGHILLTHEFQVKPEFTIYPSPNDLEVNVDHSTSLSLNNKTFSIFIKSNEDIENILIEFNQIEGILELNGPIKLYKQGGSLLKEYEENSSLSYPNFEKEKLYELIVPFKPDLLTSKILDIFTKVKFESSDGNLKSQSSIINLNTILKMEVSVQDIFKFDSLYSKFSIGTSDPNIPIRLINVELKGPESYNIQSSLKAGELIIFADQPGNYFFRLDKFEDIEINDIVLNVEYRDLNEESFKIWKYLLWNELVKLNLENYFKLLTNSLILEIDYILYELDSKISFSKKRFNSNILKSIPIKDRSQVSNLINKFISNEHDKSEVEIPFINNHIKIDVPIPTVEILQQYELKLEHSKIYTTLGEELQALLSIKSIVNKHEQKNEKANSKKVSFKDQISNKYDVEIVANADSWLINGQTKFSFELYKNFEDNNEEQFKDREYKLSLIPLKIGKLTLPRIKITKEDISFKLDEYALEIDYKNENETIYVVSEKN